jgi:hypothetical protein
MKGKSYYSFDIIKKYIVAMATILQDFKVEHSTPTYTTTGGTTTTLVDTTNLQGNYQDDYFNDYVIRHLTGTNAPQTLTITDYDDSTGTLTFATALAINAGDTYRLVKQILVPIEYAKKDKMSYLQQRKNEDDGGNKISTTLPRIGFALTGVTPDSSRMCNRLNTSNANLVSGTRDTMYAALPYNFTFDASVWTKDENDMLQIIEQLLPIFTPDITITVNEVPDLNLASDIHITLTSATPADQIEYDETSWRILTWDFTFTLMGWLYPNKSTEKVIQTVIVNIRDLDETDKIYRTLTET